MGVGYLTGQGGISSNIKSVQRGTSGIPANGSQILITISPVVLANSIVFLKYRAGSGGNKRSIEYHSAKFNSTTQLLVKVGEARTLGIPSSFEWQVIEFNNVKSKQLGSYQMVANGAVENVLSVSSVNVNKSLVVYSYHTNNTATTMQDFFICTLKSANELSFISVNGHPTSSFIDTFEWQVIEFK